MTNRVKPFYIRITDDMTPQMVQDAFDKCREFGVKDTELRDSLDCNYWVYFGVCGRDGLCYSDWSNSFHGGAQEITLDQLDEWLGLSDAVECRNGDSAYVENCTHDEIKFIGLSGNNSVAVCECITSDRRVILDKFWVSDLLKEKPETPEQKAERERVENGKAIYDLMSSIEMNHDIAGTPNTWAELRDEWQSVYIQLAKSVGYRKQ